MRILLIILLASFQAFGQTSITVSPFGGAGSDGVLEQQGYSTGIYWPGGGAYNPAWYPKTDMTGVDTVFINPTTSWGRLEIFGLKGTSSSRKTVMMRGDSIVQFEKGIRIFDCEYVDFVFTPLGASLPSRYPTAAEADSFRFQAGSSDPAVRHIAFEILGRCKSINVSGLKGETVWYGLTCKTDPQCDTLYNMPNWVMDSITLKHFWFEDVLQDVIYWGNSSNMLRADDPVNGRYILCDTLNNGGDLDTCQSPNYLPMRLGNTEIAYGVIMRAGRQGIVAGGLWSGSHRIHHLYFRHLGYELNQGQGEAIGSGGNNQNVYIYNNDIKWTFLYGIADFGNYTYIEGNTIDSTGYIDRNYAINVTEAYFLRPNTDMDSLVAANPTQFTRTGTVLNNIYLGGIYGLSSTTKVYYPVTSTKRSVIRGNRFGASTRGDGYDIAFEDYGDPTLWLTNNIACGNTKLNGSTPATITRFTYSAQSWPPLLSCKKGLIVY
jgi:hypothetical protein